MLLSVLIVSGLVAAASASGSCHSGNYAYFSGPDMCYLLLPDVFTFDQAKTNCGFEGGRLAMPKSLAADVDLKTLAGVSAVDFWLGMKDENGDKDYVYLDNTPVSGYNNWIVAKVDRTVEVCAISTPTIAGRNWKPEACDATAQAMCEAPPVPQETTCDTKKGWVKLQADKCFKAYKGHRKFNYDQAKSYCQKAGGILAKDIVSKQQRKELGKLMKFNGHFWVSYNDKDGNGVYTDTDGVSMTGHNDAFKRKLPRPGRCISFRKPRLFAKNCNRKLRVICQKPADIVT